MSSVRLRAHHRLVRRLLSVGAVALMVVGAAAPASAETPTATTDWRFNGKTSWVFGHRCSFVHQVHHVTFRDATGNVGKLKLAGCVDIVAEGFEYSGTLKLTPLGGAPTTGTVVGTVYDGPPPFPCPTPSSEGAALSFTLTPTDGPVMFLTGTWCPSEVLGAVSLTFGVLTTSPPTIPGTG